MGIFSIVVFFVIMWGLGALVTSFVKGTKISFISEVMRLAAGLTTFVILSLLLNLLHIPLDWKVYLLVSLVGIGIFFFLNRKPSFEISAWQSHIVAFLLFCGILFVYLSGAFSYPYLENDDSWGHAASAKYVSTQKTLFEPEHTYNKLFDVGSFQYIDPYPPAYAAIMGVFSQLEDSLSWTLKFFNALIISLGYLFFYAFIFEFTKSEKKALLATIVLVAMPAYFSHFIWAISLSVPIYFITMYFFGKMRESRNYFVPAAISTAAGLVTTPTHSAYFAMFIAIFFFAKLIVEKKIQVYQWGAAIAGILLILAIWWGPMFVRYENVDGFLEGIGFRSEGILNVGGTGDRNYTIDDFVVAKNVNMINSPVGLGFGVVFLLVAGLAFLFMNHKQVLKDPFIVASVLWLVLTLYAVNAASSAIKLSPFRTWMLLAIPVAILAAEGWNWLLELKGNNFFIFVGVSFVLLLLYNQNAQSINTRFGPGVISSLPIFSALLIIPVIFAFGWFLSPFLRSVGLNIKRIPAIVFVIIVFFLIFTAFFPKYAVNTAQWYPGGTWLNADELQGYVNLKELGVDTPIFSMTYRHAANIIGLDQFTCIWCKEDIDFRVRSGNSSDEELYSWLKSRNYQYVIFDSDYVLVNGENKTNQRLQNLALNSKFSLTASNPGFKLFRVN